MVKKTVTVKLQLVALFILTRFSGTRSNDCGTTALQLDERIMNNGTKVGRAEWPFLAALLHSGTAKIFCGGTLITARNVLTAAHCMQEKEVNAALREREDVLVLLGAYNIDLPAERGRVQSYVEQIYVHPDWNINNVRSDADLAILVLSESVTFSINIRPICLPNSGLPDDAIGRIVGWGKSERVVNHEPIALQTNTRILNDSYCYTTSAIAQYSSMRTFCGGVEGGSPNVGDSGGGLFIFIGSSWTQYGIISTTMSAEGVADALAYTLYTNVWRFRNWIDEVVAENALTTTTINYEQPTTHGRHFPMTTETSALPFEIVDWECVYMINGYQRYECVVHDETIGNENVTVGAMRGRHLRGYSNADVVDFYIRNGFVDYIPSGIVQNFPNLKVFGADGAQLRKVKRSDFKDLKNLQKLTLDGNLLEIFDEDTLWDLPDLVVFEVWGNQLKVLEKNTLEKNTKLETVIFCVNEVEFLSGDFFKHNVLLNEINLMRNRLMALDENLFAANVKLRKLDCSHNQIEILPRNLFKNNALLETVKFDYNKLTNILIDIGQLRNIIMIDFHGNTCINAAAQGYRDVLRMQNTLTSQCRR